MPSNHEPNETPEEAISALSARVESELGTTEQDLSDYIDHNPIFRDEFSFYNENPNGHPSIESSDLEAVISIGSEGRSPTSEWEAAVIYGYKMGLLFAVLEIEEQTHNLGVDFDAHE
jgi:hypothetical protein